jgi:hypothetical protein
MKRVTIVLVVLALPFYAIATRQLTFWGCDKVPSATLQEEAS